MSVDFKIIRNHLLNKELCILKVGYGSLLRIGLGKKIFYENPKLKGKYCAEWDFYTDTCSWRVSKGHEILCGYYDENEFSNEVLELEEQEVKLVDLIQVNIFDIRLVFDNQLVIEYFYQSKEEPILSIMGNEKNICYELSRDGWSQVDPEEPSNTLTEIESVLSNLSEECDERWSKVVPENVNYEECSNCFYFRGLNGHFYFWDYGICSNKNSPFDGKLVGVKTGCSCFSTLKDI